MLVGLRQKAVLPSVLEATVEVLEKATADRIPGDRVVAVAHLDPGVRAGAATYDVKDQAIPRIEWKRRGDKRKGPALRLQEVPPVAFSEALLDVQEVLAEQEC